MKTTFCEATWGLGDSTAHRCLELIRRRAPAMMRAGGGPLVQAAGDGTRRLITAELRAEVLRLWRDTGLSKIAIGRAAGVPTSSVYNIIEAAGLMGIARRPAVRAAHHLVIQAHRTRAAVLAELARGKSRKEVAFTLGVTVQTVTKHRKRALLEAEAA